MNTKTRSATRDLVLAALFLALAFVLPMITGHVHAMLPPFHGSEHCAAREMCTPHLIPALPRTPPRCWRR